MRSHVVAKHDDARYARFQCKVCLKRFYSGNDYRRHQERHRPVDPKKEMVKRGECYWPGCGKVYESGNAESVRYHLVTVHQEREYAKFECADCGTLFYDMRGYRKHMKGVHGEEVRTDKMQKIE